MSENNTPVAVSPAKPAKAVMSHRYGIDGGANTPQIGLGTTLVITPVEGSPISTQKVLSIKMPTLAGKDIDITGFSDSFDVYMPGVLNVGEIDVECEYLKTQSADLYALVNIPGTAFEITYNDGAIRNFIGFLNSYDESLSLRDKTVVKFKARATGMVQFS